MNYIPILKYKERIDIKSYIDLDMDNKDITPLIELFQIENIEMKKIAQQKPFYLSILVDNNMRFKTAVEVYIEALKFHTNIIPVINSDYNYDSKKDTFKAAKKLFKTFDKIALKVNGIDQLYIRENLENILLSIVDDYKKIEIFLDIDYAYKHTTNSMVEYFSDAIDYFLDEIDDDILNFSIAGSIVKVSSIGLGSFEDSEDGCNYIHNHLLGAYHILKDKYKKLNIKYSDYTIDEKHMFTDDMNGGGSFYPSVKYTLENGNICIYKSRELSEFGKYIDIAKIIHNRADYSSTHCTGCKYVNDIVLGNTNGKGTGNPSTWKTNMISHHIIRLSELLS